jgi:hypothetical protein
MGNSDSNENKKTTKGIVRMRFRDLRNGVEKVMDGNDGTVKMKKDEWVMMQSVFTTLATLWADMCKTNGWVGKTDTDVTADLKDTASKCKDMTMTKAERKAKADAMTDLMQQMADLQQQMDNL